MREPIHIVTEDYDDYQWRKNRGKILITLAIFAILIIALIWLSPIIFSGLPGVR